MSVATILYGLLADDPTLAEKGLTADKITSGRSLSEGNLPARPFAVIRWGVENPGMGGMTRRLVTIWVHDEPGTYDAIDRILSRLKAILDGVVNLPDGEGNWLSQASWQGNSGDLFDPGYGTNTKNTSFEIIGTGV